MLATGLYHNGRSGSYDTLNKPNGDALRSASHRDEIYSTVIAVRQLKQSGKPSRVTTSYKIQSKENSQTNHTPSSQLLKKTVNPEQSQKDKDNGK
ncbi:hypothetical protein Tco_1501405 [Tanacetum coccineum]